MKMKHWQWWLLVTVMSFFVLAGQTVATILGRFYYDQGGDSKWMATLVQSAGSPLLLLPLLFLPSSASPTTPVPYSLTSKLAMYIFFGIVIACNNLMYSYGLLFLPVSTYSLICATQLAFNAVFSYYINSEKLTALVLNSVILLTFSAALLGIHSRSASSIHVTGEKYASGFILTLAASALFSLLLSLLQLTFEKYFKRMTFRIVFELQTCTNFIAACASVVGLFVSGEWRSLRREMEEFKKGTEAYVMTLVWIAISWQLVSVGIVGLVFVASSLLANMIGTLGLPLVPIFAVIFLNDRMDGVKVMALLIALWGFLSYIYQQYLDDSKAKKLAASDSMEISVVSSSPLMEPLDSTSLSSQAAPTMTRNLQWWFKVSTHSFLVLAGQSVATLLGRFYYDQGGNSKWLQTLTFSAGFPILYLPLLITTRSTSLSTSRPLPLVKISVIYIIIGLMATADSFMYSYGLLYLSVSTYSLVSATQLGFNAVFSYFINSERFTHLTFNSVIILTFSAAIIAFQPHSDDSSETYGGKYMLGFILTLAASATYSLILSLMELTFDKIIKCRALDAVLNMQIYTSLVSTVAAITGLFASGEWRDLKGDMEGFKKGRLSYVMTLVWASICWQVTNVGLVGLIFEVSSLFSNVISSLGVPIVPVFAVILFHDKINGIKVMSLLMALWGFVSYFYQHYLDYKREKTVLMEVRESPAIYISCKIKYSPTMSMMSLIRSIMLAIRKPYFDHHVHHQTLIIKHIISSSPHLCSLGNLIISKAKLFSRSYTEEMSALSSPSL